MFRQWLHHLFDPHCPECTQCETCQVLRQQLEIANEEKERLFNLLFERQKPINPPAEKAEEPARVSSFIPWRVREQMLASKSKVEAQIRAAYDKEIDSLEKEVGINEASKESGEQGQGSDVDGKAVS